MIPGGILQAQASLSRNYQDLRFCPQDHHGDLAESRRRSLEKLGTVYPEMENSALTSLPYTCEMQMPPTPGKLTEAAFVMMKDAGLTAALNMGEHLVLTKSGAADELASVLRAIREAEDAIADNSYAFAFDPELGYLSYRPALSGSGLRANLVLHLPLLAFLKQIKGASQTLSEEGYDLSPVSRPDGRNPAKLFILGKNAALDQPDEHLIEGLLKTAGTLLEKEERLQSKALFGNGEASTFLDQVWRSYGVLLYARRLSQADLLTHWSNLRLGALHAILPLSTQSVDHLLTLANDSAFLREDPKEKTFLYRRADSVRRAISGG